MHMTQDTRGRGYAHRSALALLPALSLALLLAGCGKPPEAKVELVRPVRAVAVAMAPVAQTTTYSGDVWPRFQSALGFRLPGKIIERRVDVGQRVTAGQVLALLDPEDVRLAADRARSGLSAAEADLAQAQLDHDRYKKLLVSQTISQAEFDRRLNILTAASSRAASARAELDMARNQTDYSTLKADADGVVVSVEAEAGEVVMAGKPIVRIAQTGAKDVVIAVPESRLADLRAGSRIEVALWADPSAKHEGTVREIAPRADTTTRTYAVKVAVDDPTDQVRLGMTATVAFIAGGQGEAIMIPSTALTQVGEAPAVWVVEAATESGNPADPIVGTVKLRPIKVLAYREETVVVAEGLKPGEVVVTAGAHKLAADQRVRVLDKAARL
jgi:membrane fusion protein, multidrug efflux system